ncbi:MAG TPA: 3-keto-5-aminohexanoate cleavage protein [Dehalococcoidia bacterium]|nr:3-keto-5-aminohexanoate cleavage protein [Dehalococcoidia bacterium]
MEKLIIEAAINENARRSLNPHIPVTPEEIARDAVACAEAGAAVVHFHAREPETGKPRMNGTELYAEAMERIRNESDVLFYPTFQPGLPAEERWRHIFDLAENPRVRLEIGACDMGSVNFSRFDVANRRVAGDWIYLNPATDNEYCLRRCADLGLRPRMSVWEPGGLRTALKFREIGLLTDPLFVQFYLSDDLPQGYPPGARALLNFIDLVPSDVRLVWFAGSVSGDATRVNGLAILMGGHVRVGLGDDPAAGGGKATNADLVARMVRLAGDLGREVATPAEARTILGLGKRG